MRFMARGGPFSSLRARLFGRLPPGWMKMVNSYCNGWETDLYIPNSALRMTVCNSKLEKLN